MKKRRILLALIMLVISGITLTTATYAWFSINTRVTVEEIDVKATASGGIQISHDAATWSNTVTVDNLKSVDTNYIPDISEGKQLSPVTTVGINGGNSNFDFYLGTLSEDGSKVTLESIEDASEKYVSFDLYFYSARPYTLKFGADTIVDVVTGGTDAGLKQSMRVGFLVQGTDKTSTTSTALALTGGTEQTIWEPNSDKRSDYIRVNGLAEDNKTLAYMGGKAEGDEVALNDSTTFETIAAGTHNLITSAVGAYPTSTIFDFEAGITKVRVYAWIEGQDIDNEDQVSLGSGVKLVLDFNATFTDA